MCLKNMLIVDQSQGKRHESKCRTAKHKAIQEHFGIKVTQKVKEITKYQGKSLTMRKLPAKRPLRLINKKKLKKHQEIVQYN